MAEKVVLCPGFLQNEALLQTGRQGAHQDLSPAFGDGGGFSATQEKTGLVTVMHS